jgi:4a-hydroxytetrahydrobiopterin dehydratase
MTEPLTEHQIAEKLQGLNGWKRNDLEGHSGIMKVFATGDFLSGLALVTRLAVLAEKANHHPDVVLSYPKVSVRLTTHDAAGLTAKDFELAGQIDALKL